ncbi:MAG: hypothetical protein ACK45B_10635 [Limisphaerales bacterium]
MDLSSTLKIAGGVLALLMILPLVVDAIRRNGAGQSFAMWALWAMLDLIITISLMAQRGNFWLTAGFALGSLILAVTLLAKGRFSWGRLETLVAALVAGCVAVWAVGGPRAATLATTAAIVVAGLPGMVALWREPQRSQAFVWAGYTVANLCALAGGAEWSLSERFAPAVFATQTLALAAIGWREKPRPAGKMNETGAPASGRLAP